MAKPKVIILSYPLWYLYKRWSLKNVTSRNLEDYFKATFKKLRLNKEEPPFKAIEPTMLHFKHRLLLNKVVTNNKSNYCNLCSERLTMKFLQINLNTFSIILKTEIIQLFELLNLEPKHWTIWTLQWLLQSMDKNNMYTLIHHIQKQVNSSSGRHNINNIVNNMI